MLAWLTLPLWLSSAASAADLPAAFAAAAEEFGVPEKLLLALSYEASHWNPDAATQWGGYGLFDLREGGPEGVGGGPDIEAAAQLLDVSPDDIIADPALQIRGAAALLAQTARLTTGDGSLPPADDLLEWWDAVRAFSGRHEPNLQGMYADYIFELVNFGAEDAARGLRLRPEPVDHWSLAPIPPPGTCDYGGCYQFVAASSSNYSNYSRGASDINYIVIHTVQGSYSGCISWFQNSSASVSAHYVVRSSDGQVTQMVDEEDVAWHAGNWTYNEQSVGIEHEGYVEDPGTWYTDAMYSSSAALSADIAARNGISISRSYIIAHSEVPGATHTDPGSGWDWDYYMTLIGGGGGTPTGDLIGVVADQDIYNGARLVGASVWIAETGETATTDEDGYYRFYDLTLETYTIHAVADGYAEGTCTKTLASGDNWCSIALVPAGDTPDPGGEPTDDTGDGDTPGPADTADPTGTPGDPPPVTELASAPGNLVPLRSLDGGCSHAGGAFGGIAGLSLALLALVRRRP